MPPMPVSEQRLAFRAILERPQVTLPGSVYDPVSARLARSAGYDLGLFAGSVAAATILGAPDLVLITLSEFAEQARRISRAGTLPLLVDADHGYGNALNVRRTVEELETAGVAALTIEDTLLPRRHGAPEGELISEAEFGRKLRAALDARVEGGLAVIGRTGALASAGLDEALARVRVCAAAGVDAVFVLGVSSVDQLEALAAATDLPIVLNAAPAPAADLAARRVRVILQGHLPYFVALKALLGAYRHLRAGGAAADLRAQALPADLQALALAETEYAAWRKEYLEVE